MFMQRLFSSAYLVFLKVNVTFDILEAVPSINYIGRQLNVPYTGRQMYGEIFIYQKRLSMRHLAANTSCMLTTRPLSKERTGSECT